MRHTVLRHGPRRAQVRERRTAPYRSSIRQLASVGLGRIVALYHLPIHIILESLTYLVPLFLKRQCYRTLGAVQGCIVPCVIGLQTARTATGGKAIQAPPRILH